MVVGVLVASDAQAFLQFPNWSNNAAETALTGTNKSHRRGRKTGIDGKHRVKRGKQMCICGGCGHTPPGKEKK